MRAQVCANARKPELPAEKPLLDLLILQPCLVQRKQHILAWSNFSVILARPPSITSEPSLKSGHNLLSSLKIGAKGQPRGWSICLLFGSPGRIPCSILGLPARPQASH